MPYVYGIHAVDSLLRHNPRAVQRLWVQSGRDDKRIAALLARHLESSQFLEKPLLDLEGALNASDDRLPLGNHSVLKSLRDMAGELSHISLREPAADDADEQLFRVAGFEVVCHPRGQFLEAAELAQFLQDSAQEQGVPRPRSRDDLPSKLRVQRPAADIDVPGVGGDAGWVWVAKPGFADAFARYILEAKTRREVKVDLKPGFVVRGRGTDDQGRPVAGATVTLGVRPEHVRLTCGESGEGPIRMKGKVQRIEDLGHEALVQVVNPDGDERLTLRAPGDVRRHIYRDSELDVEIDRSRLHFFDADTGDRIE